MLLSEYDPARRAVINPDQIYHPVKNFPDTVVSVFSKELFDKLTAFFDGKVIAKAHDADGVWPIYEIFWQNQRLALVKARVGAPACVGIFEDIIRFGARRIILTGNCGVLDRSIGDLGIIIPTAALRDEGTSYHYAPPADMIPVNHRYTDLFEEICREHGYSTAKGITWTTDAFYRETPDKVARRKAMGAVCVEMECAAMQAMCDFRGVEFFQFLYAGDNLEGADWDPRSLSGNAKLGDKEKIALLAAELAVKIKQSETI